jgi:glycosyltransferase involved in cell wall biosynthesis
VSEVAATKVEISVVIPFFNEEANIDPLFAELGGELDKLARPYEIIAVDDGSSDGTRAALRRAREHRSPALRVLARDRNLGQSAAFLAGFAACRGSLVVTLDGDLQIDPRDIAPLLETLEAENLDMVYGWRQNRRDGRLKRISTRVANYVRNRITGEDIRDTGCPLKVMRREVLTAFPPFDGMHRFYVTLAHLHGFRTREQAVGHRPRAHGVSKYGIRNRLGRSLRDCLAIRWMQHRRIGRGGETVEIEAQGASAVEAKEKKAGAVALPPDLHAEELSHE